MPALHAARWAAGEAARRHPRLRLVYVADVAYVSARPFFVDWDAIDTREREAPAERPASWQEKYPDVTVQRVVTGGRPVNHLLEHATDAQLLLVRGRDAVACCCARTARH